ncbi:MAG: aldose epimerase family protein [Rikenellaceae bacterium]
MRAIRVIIYMIWGVVAYSCCTPSALTKSGLDASRFEKIVDGESVALYTLTNSEGMEVCVTNLGARVVSIMAKDREDSWREVTLGFNNIDDYIERRMAIGGTVGRVAGRIKGGHIVIDDKEYTLPINDGGNTLHGGVVQWHNRPFKVVKVTTESITMRYISPDGESGFPGEVTLDVIYSLDSDGGLLIEYEASTTAPTQLNLTNHTFFNLSGDPTVNNEENIIVIEADSVCYVDPIAVVNDGTRRAVAGTPMDLRVATRIGDVIDSDHEQTKLKGGFDHGWMLNRNSDGSLGRVILHSPKSGITMETTTSQEVVHLSAASFLNGKVIGRGGNPLIYRGGVCVETQHQSVDIDGNVPESATLRPGRSYRGWCLYRFY